jgi:Protein of unknown function (DUF3237)
MVDPSSSPHLDFALELRVNIGPTLELGPSPFGIRRTVPITGGTFRGPRICGRVLAGGADWQLVQRDGLTFVDAQYVIETDDGVRIEVRNQGIRHASPEVLDRIAAGEIVPPGQYYFRTTPRFYPPDGQHEWLQRSIFLGNAERYADLVLIRVWMVT